MNPSSRVGFNDLLMIALWLQDANCASAAGDYWHVYNRTEESNKVSQVDTTSSTAPKNTH